MPRRVSPGLPGSRDSDPVSCPTGHARAGPTILVTLSWDYPSSRLQVAAIFTIMNHNLHRMVCTCPLSRQHWMTPPFLHRSTTRDLQGLSFTIFLSVFRTCRNPCHSQYPHNHKSMSGIQNLNYIPIMDFTTNTCRTPGLADHSQNPTL